jgi:serine/threonine-protein kinase
MGKSASEQLIGRTIAGKFLIEAPIGAGAMGAVFRARQIALEKTVAIKVLHGEHADDASFVARFQREAKAASRLNHPNSMQVIDFGAEPDGLLYIAMEYLDGRSLHRVIREDRPLSPARIADILMQTLAALAVAHDMGVVHRDLKPDNIMILSGTDDDGRPKDIVKVCDFGIAKITDSRAYRDGAGRTSDAPLTTAGLMIGTPEYMSPEQGSGQKLDARSDLYSVGVILFEMLTGQVPFETENAIGTILKHINDAPRRPSEIVPSVDKGLEAVCLRALRKQREDRYPGAREMRADLRAVLDGRAPDAPESAPAVQVVTEASASTNAATVRFAAPAIAEVPKATLIGTASTAPGGHKPRRRIAVGAIAGAVGFVGALLLLLLNRPHPAASVASTAEGPSEAPSTNVAPLVDVAPLAPLDALRASASPGGMRMPGSSKAVATASGGKGVVVKTPAPSATPAASTTPAPAPPPVAVVAPTPPPAETADPSFDPDHGYVEVGLINGQGVRDSAVRGALHGTGISACYKSALRAKGARATGVATLSLSFDEGGAARSAIVTGGDFLPGLTRCVQGSTAGLHVPSSQVDSGGGTAEVFLAFKVR